MTYPPQQPYTLQQQPPQPGYSPTNGIAGIVKALMDGNDAYKQQGGHPSPGPSLVPGSAVPGAMGPTSMGGRAGPTPLTDPGAMMPGLGASPPPPMPPQAAAGGPPPGGGMGQYPMSQAFPTGGAAPMDPTALAGSGLPQTPGMPPSAALATAGAPGVDPISQALMSPIPGQ